jgi:hypothetical protein
MYVPQFILAVVMMLSATGLLSYGLLQLISLIADGLKYRKEVQKHHG